MYKEDWEKPDIFQPHKDNHCSTYILNKNYDVDVENTYTLTTKYLPDIDNIFKGEKKVKVLEAPTGVGKSTILYTYALNMSLKDKKTLFPHPTLASMNKTLNYFKGKQEVSILPSDNQKIAVETTKAFLDGKIVSGY